MSDLIRREDAIHILACEMYAEAQAEGYDTTLDDYIPEAKAWMNDAPSADAIEVVRCRDCKYWHSNTEFCDVWSHANIAQRTLADDYCSYGVREDGEA